MDYGLMRNALLNRARYLDTGHGEGSDDYESVIDFMGGKFQKGKPLTYEQYKKMWKAKHGNLVGAKKAFEVLHSKKKTTGGRLTKKSVTKKRATGKKLTKKSVTKKGVKGKAAPLTKSPWIKFIQKHRGQGLTFTELSQMYHSGKY